MSLSASIAASCAEVDLAHQRVRPHVLARAVGDHAPVVEHGDMPDDLEGDVHVVLDHEHRHRGVQALDEARHHLRLGGGEAGGGLVEEEDAWAGIRLRAVVLPAPLGPMSARRSPARTASVTSSTARSPPNAFETPFSSSAYGSTSAQPLTSRCGVPG